MQAKLEAKAKEPPYHLRPPLPPQPVVEFIPVKKAHREQFEAGLALAREEHAKGTKVKHILEMLEGRGLKTRTGRKWTYGILQSELKKAEARSVTSIPVEPQRVQP